MRNLITLLLAISCAAYGHDIQGVFLRDGAASDIPRTTFPFDAFKKVQSGRVYTPKVKAAVEKNKDILFTEKKN